VNKKSQKIVELKQNDSIVSGVNRQSSVNYLAKGNGFGLSVTERLYQDATDRLERNYFSNENDINLGNQVGRSSKLMQNAYGNQYQPHISHQSKFISEQSNMFNGNNKDFIERQNAFLQKQQEKREQASNKYA